MLNGIVHPHAQPLLDRTTCASTENIRGPFLFDHFLNQAYNAGSCVDPDPVGSLPLANNV